MANGQLNGAKARWTEPRILPLSAAGGSERRLCAVLALEDGGILALQATVLGGERSTLSTFAALLAAGGDGWRAPVSGAIDLPVPSPLSLTLAPVLLGGGVDGYAVAWAFESGGFLVLTPTEARVVGGPANGRLSALSAAAGFVLAAVRPRPDGQAGLFFRRDGGDWEELPAGPLACPSGEAVTAICLFEGQVYAAVSDAKSGFRLWRAPLGSPGPWEPVLENGAWRHGYNRSVSAMMVAGGRLLVAADGPDTRHVRIGDEHPEIVAVAPDGSWTLVSGHARFTPEGLRRPETVGGPGTPEFTGLTIGGLRAEGRDLVAWLKPRGVDRSRVSICRWSAETGAWSAAEPIPVPDLPLTSLVTAGDGTILVAAGADLALRGAADGAGRPEERRRPLLIAAPPQ